LLKNVEQKGLKRKNENNKDRNKKGKKTMKAAKKSCRDRACAVQIATQIEGKIDFPHWKMKRHASTTLSEESM